MPELSRTYQTLPAESLTSREEENCFCFFSRLSPGCLICTATNQIKRISLYPQSFVVRKLMPGSLHAHKHSFTHAHTHSYCTSKQSLTECSELWQTDPPGSKKEGFQVWPSGLPLIPSISSPLGMGHRFRVSLLFTKTHSQTHTQHKLKLLSVLRWQVSCCFVSRHPGWDLVFLTFLLRCSDASLPKLTQVIQL